MLSSSTEAVPRTGTHPAATLEAGAPLPRQRLWQRLRARGACTLTVRTPYGEPCSFPLRLLNRCLRPGEALWFLVERGSDLAFDVTHSPQVEITVLEDDLCPWTLSGRATLICDASRAEFTPGVPHEHLRRLPEGDSELARRTALLRVDVQVAPTHLAT